MNKVTLQALAAFPDQLEAHYAAIPEPFKTWEPEAWDGIPSEPFNAIGHVCHVRDIEIDGYHVRFERTLNESNPGLASLDGLNMAVERSYATSNAEEALNAFRLARKRTLELIATLQPEQLQRTAIFEGYGTLSLRSLVHYLCSHDQQHLAGLQWLLGKIEASRTHPLTGTQG